MGGSGVTGVVTAEGPNFMLVSGLLQSATGSQILNSINVIVQDQGGIFM